MVTGPAEWLSVRSDRRLSLQLMASSETPPATGPDELHPAGPSSRILNVPKFFAEHKRDQVQAFAYDEDIHRLPPFETPDAFNDFLGVPQNILQPEPPQSDALFTLDDFVQVANSVVTSIKNQRNYLTPFVLRLPSDVLSFL